jgi:hypothetical protein
MRRGYRLRFVAVTLALAALAFAGVLISTPRSSADDRDDRADNKDTRIEQGFDIAPVYLNLEHKNRALVGLGSYIVNAVGDCDGCHSAGPPSEFATGGNPYFRFPPFTGTEQINLATYLGGGRDFGPFGSAPQIPHLYSRNLTPDKTGLPAGGHTFQEFLDIMRKGTDFDHVYPNCTAPGMPANCLMPPNNGDLLQVMRWPFFRNMTDHDLRAIYEYLSAVPCNPGPVIAGAPYLQNVCE